MSRDSEVALKEYREELMAKELDAFHERFGMKRGKSVGWLDAL